MNARYTLDGVRIVDTTNVGLFKHGAERAVACIRSGCTVETVTHYATRSGVGSPKNRGVIAACEVALGWHDVGEREARAHGMTRDEATRFVEEILEMLRAP